MRRIKRSLTPAASTGARTTVIGGVHPDSVMLCDPDAHGERDESLGCRFSLTERASSRRSQLAQLR